MRHSRNCGPGIPLKCLHGRMKQERRMGTYDEFFENRSVLFSTDVASRGLDFPAVDWVVQVDCPEDVPAYIHRVGRTARFSSGGKSVLFVMPSEMKMIQRLEDAKIPIHSSKPNTKRLQSISGLLASLLVKFPDMQYLAQRAFTTYLRSIYLQRDKEIFDVDQLPIEEFSASLGLPMTPKIRFLNCKIKRKNIHESHEQEHDFEDDNKGPRKVPQMDRFKEESESDLLLAKETLIEGKENEPAVLETHISKKKKLKINLHRPAGTRVVFDDEGNALPPLAALADMNNGDCKLEIDKVKERYAKLKEDMKQRDKEDKLIHRQRLREQRLKEKMKLKRARTVDEDGEIDDGHSGSDGEATNGDAKRSKIYFDSDGDEGGKLEKNAGSITDSISLAEQEALALKLLSSMHS